MMLEIIANLFPEETLEYSPDKGDILNKSEANSHLGFDFQDGWVL
jgi:hypothetical protein